VDHVPDLGDRRERDDVEPEKVCVDGELTISDCSRIVHVEFWTTTPDELDNALHKARLLHRRRTA